MLNVLDEVGAQATFFVDYLMLKFLEKENCKRTLADLKAIEEQLMDIVRRGHRIELHIHSHWIDAKYNGDGTWDFQISLTMHLQVSQKRGRTYVSGRSGLLDFNS